MGSLMPGAFLAESANHLQPSSSRAVTDQRNTYLIEEDQLKSFSKSEYLVNKGRSQRHLLRQLEGCVYIIIGYQLVKFCHLACLLPFVLDLMMESAISVKAVADPDNWSLLETIAEVLNKKEHETGASQGTQRQNITRFFCLAVYAKFLLVVLYHAFFVFWIKLIADDGHLESLVNGSWWLVSFIGESVAEGYDPESSLWLRLWQLGLVQLIVCDFLVLMLQLTLYQAVYLQSSKSLSGLPLNAKEIEIVRPHNVRVPGDPIHKIPQRAAPNVLNIRLHDCLNKNSYLGFDMLAT